MGTDDVVNDQAVVYGFLSAVEQADERDAGAEDDCQDAEQYQPDTGGEPQEKGGGGMTTVP